MTTFNSVSCLWDTLQDKIRYSLLLKIHIHVIMLQAKNLQLLLSCFLYVCIIYLFTICMYYIYVYCMYVFQFIMVTTVFNSYLSILTFIVSITLNRTFTYLSILTFIVSITLNSVRKKSVFFWTFTYIIIILNSLFYLQDI